MATAKAPVKRSTTGDDKAETSELIHRIAVTLTHVSMALEEAAGRAGSAARGTAQVARSGAATGKAAAVRVKQGAVAGRDAAAETLERARSMVLGLALGTGLAVEQATKDLQKATNELSNRARAARAAGIDFYARHREEILAVLLTAAKVAAVIGIRRLSRRAQEEDDNGGRKGRRMAAAATVLVAVVTQLGGILARRPDALPILRKLYREGGPSEQGVVGMLLGPALASDPEHAVEVVREFLEAAADADVADTLAERSLAPMLEQNPELIDTVLPWLHAAAPLVQRGGLVALSRAVADHDSRLGDILAAAVVVLEDHDEEVREGLRWLLEAASRVDLEATAATVARWRRQSMPGERRAVMERLPLDLQERVRELEDDD